MKKIIYLLPVLLLFFACSSDDDMPEDAEESVFTVEYSQSGDSDQYRQEITLYSSYGWEDSETGAEAEAILNSENEALPGSFSYSTVQNSPMITVTYSVTPLNPETVSSLETTFRIYKNGDLIDTQNVSYTNEDILDTEKWEYFADEDMAL